MNNFATCVNGMSLYNEKTAKMLFSVCSSQIVDKYFTPGIKIGNDVLRYRLSLLLISPSRSGKGQATKVSKWLLEAAGIEWIKLTSFTDAALIGSIDRERIKQMKSIPPEMLLNNPELGEMINPVIPGELSRSRVIFFDEAKTMISPNRWTQNTLEILQEALDDPGWVRKKLADVHPIEYETHVSIIATTYYLKSFHQTLLEQGLFQRMLVLVNNFTPDMRNKLNKALCKDWSDENTKKNTIALGKELRDIVSVANIKCKSEFITPTEDARQMVHSLIQEQHNHICKTFSGSDLEVLLPFPTGSIEKIWRLAAASAILDGRFIIGARDVANVKEIISMYIDSIINEILSNIEGSKTQQEIMEKKIIYLLKPIGGIGIAKSQLYDRVAEYTGKDLNRTKVVIKRMIANGDLIIKKHRDKDSPKGRPFEYVSLHSRHKKKEIVDGG